MGLYLVTCDEQQINEHWSDWLNSEPNSLWFAIPNVHTSSLGSTNDPSTLISIQFNPKKGTRITFIAGLLFGLALCELFTLALPHILGWATHISIFLISIILVIGVILFWLFLTCSPLLSLGIYHETFIAEEAELFQKVEQNGIDFHPIATSSQWILFPNDVSIIQLTAFGIFTPQLLALLGLGGVIPLIAPIFSLIAPFVIVELTYEFANKEIQNTFSALAYWKLALMGISRRMYLFFFLPALFYWLMNAFTRIHIAVAYISPLDTTKLSFKDVAIAVLTFDIDKILKSTNVKNINSIIYYSIDHTNNSKGNSISIFLSLTMIVLTIALILFFVWAIKHEKFFKVDFSFDRKLAPAFVPSAIAQESNSSLTNVHIVATYVWVLSLIAIGMILFSLSILWAWGVHIDWIPIDWIVPFVWYQSLVGLSVGAFGSHVLSVAIFSPLLLWFLMWLYSLMDSCWRLAVSLPSFRGKEHRARVIIRDLCQQLSIGKPILQIDDRAAGWPVTTPIFPTSRFCVIHLSDALIKELTDEQLRLILAHELAHVTLHVRKLWIMQLLSRMSILGTGYLTPLLDYWKMEVEADDFAVRVVGDCDAFLELLDMLPQIELNASLNQLGNHYHTDISIPYNLAELIVASAQLIYKHILQFNQVLHNTTIYAYIKDLELVSDYVRYSSTNW